MAGMNELNNQLGRVPMGQNGRFHQWGVAKFNSTDATSTIKVKLRKVEAVIPVFAGAPATDETLYWADTLSADGTFTVPATGVITIGRTGAGKTAAIPIVFLIIGTSG